MYIIIANDKYGTWTYGQPNSGLPFHEEERARPEVVNLKSLEPSFTFKVVRLIGRHEAAEEGVAA